MKFDRRRRIAKLKTAAERAGVKDTKTSICNGEGSTEVRFKLGSEDGR